MMAANTIWFCTNTDPDEEKLQQLEMILSDAGLPPPSGPHCVPVAQEKTLPPFQRARYSPQNNPPLDCRGVCLVQVLLQGCEATAPPGQGGLGHCPQEDALWPELSVRQHLEAHAAVRGMRKEDAAVLISRYTAR